MTATWETQPGPTPPLQDEPPSGTSFTNTAPPNPAHWAEAPPSALGTHGAGHPYPAPTPPPPLPPSSSPPTRRGSGRRAAYAVVGVTALVGMGFGAGLLVRHDSRPASPPALVAAPTPTTQVSQQPSTPLVQDNSEEPAAAVAEALGPAVVQIELGQGLGSGVIYDKSGLILTNAHVVAGTETGGQGNGATGGSNGTGGKVTVRLKDGSSLPGTVLGADSQSDIAVVRVTPQGDLPVARLAEDKAKVGQMTIGIGSPFGLQETVTAGIVSAVDRPVEGESGISINMLQTDAPINPGNSGGALANRRGEVIGINSAIYSQKGENNGIGFAIPIQTAKAVADKIVNGESLDHAYLGVTSKSAVDGQAGAAIVSVSPGSPAAAAGIQDGDIVTAVDGQPIKDSQDLSATVVGHSPGDEVKVQVRRGDGSTTTIDVKLGTRPASASTSTPQSPGRGGQNGLGGN